MWQWRIGLRKAWGIFLTAYRTIELSRIIVRYSNVLACFWTTYVGRFSNPSLLIFFYFQHRASHTLEWRGDVNSLLRLQMSTLSDFYKHPAEQRHKIGIKTVRPLKTSRVFSLFLWKPNLIFTHRESGCKCLVSSACFVCPVLSLYVTVVCCVSCSFTVRDGCVLCVWIGGTRNVLWSAYHN